MMSPPTIHKPLSDDEASKEMKKMVAFIMQEAAEKTRELQVKADEEFNIEKAKIVRLETVNLEQLYARKLKLAESVQINKARLQVLQARDQVLDDIREEATKRLQSISSSATAYQQLLNGLVLQCLYRLIGEKVEILCRADDVAMVETAIKYASNEYAKATGASPQVHVNTEKPLAATGAGGVVGTSHGGRIRCDSTLEKRLEYAMEKMLPTLRVQLFGNSPNRNFFD